MNRHVIRQASIVAVLTTTFLAPAQTPLGTAFSYQGRLETAAGPVSGPHDLQFLLYGVPEGGVRVGGPICADNVNVGDGLFTVPLDFGAVFDGNERWLEIGVRADSTAGNCAGGAYTPLSGRQRVAATPYALQARGLFVDDFGRVAIGTTTPISQLTIDGGLTLRDVNDDDVAFSTGNFYIKNGGNQQPAYHYQSDPEQHEFLVGGGLAMKIAPTGDVGIGTATPLARVHAQTASSTGRGFYGLATATSGAAYGAFFQSNSSSGVGVVGSANAASGSAYGVFGQSASSEGRGVSGLASAASGVTYGVYGESASQFGGASGVHGFSSSGEGSGVSGSGQYGGRFESTTPGPYGVGVYGSGDDQFGVSIGINTGVLGVSRTATGAGVYGYAANSGVEGESVSENGAGVRGRATSSGVNYGVAGRSDSSSGRGVEGRVTVAGNNYGVYGVDGGNASYAVYASGDMGASGLKPFRIDHPDDPANKYLLHYAAESPEVINFYRGTVLLDGAGAAIVELPHYFAKINKNPSYQLTAIGAPMPMLHVATEIDEHALNAGAKAEPGEAAPICLFRIAGGKPQARVSWEVKAVRNDRWAQKRGAPVEVEKHGLENGTYQHPELYGQPKERGMNYDAGRGRAALPTASESTPRQEG